MSGVLDVSDGTSFLQALWEHLSFIIIPALRHSQKWGELSQQHVNQFLHSLENYVEFLKSKLLVMCTMCAYVPICTCRCTEKY